MLVLWPPILDLNPISSNSATPPLSSPVSPPSPVFEPTIALQAGGAITTLIPEDSAVIEDEESSAARTEAQDRDGENATETMATNIPAKLNTPDLRPFIVRASQLEKAKPVIAYWCEYWIVNQILARGLHNGDEECLQYTTTLMDKLEEIKAQNASNDAIVDDTAGQAYVEQFATETFLRADRTVQANKVTKQTADTFQASATFFELINIWGQPDTETQAKIKYAKWNAIRILKALKDGLDPNESNPKPQPEPEPEEDLPALDPNDPEVAALGGPSKPRQASVEEVPDEQDSVQARLARQSNIDRSLHPSAQVSARASPGLPPSEFESNTRNGFPYSAAVDDQVSPMESSPKDRQGSAGGGYFPEVPTFTGQTQDSTLPTAPLDDAIDLGLPDTSVLSPPGTKATPDFPPPPVNDQSSAPPQDYYKQVPPPSAPQPYFPPPPTQPTYQPAPPIHPTYQPAPLPYIPPAAPGPAPAPILRNGPFNKDDASITKAQKHAKWAMSALNFDDVETAVKELRAALQTLGAQ